MFKMFPRETAMSEVTWTPENLQSYSNFTNRLVLQKQRFFQMGANYDHETIPQIGTWGPSVATTGVTNFYDITTNVTAAGELDVNFWYTSGADGLSLSSVALLVNGAQVDIDSHAGFAGDGSTYTLYIVHLPETVPGAVYKIQAVVAGYGGTNSTGIVYLPNWN
jgi:hexosaminidase